MVQSAATTKLTVLIVASDAFQCSNMSNSRSRRSRDEVDADAGGDEMPMCVKVGSI